MRATSGSKSRPIASSLGRMRDLMASMRGLKPSMSNTLKSAGVKPWDALPGPPQRYVVSGSSGKIGRRIRLKSKRERLEEDSPGASTSMISLATGSKAAREWIRDLADEG